MATQSKTTGKRYSPQERQQIIDFVHQYNTDNGRGGATTASKKYAVSLLTISNWMKKSGTPATPGKKIKPTAGVAPEKAAKPEKAVKPLKAAKAPKPEKAAKPAKVTEVAKAPTAKKKPGRPKGSVFAAVAPITGNGKRSSIINELAGLDQAIAAKRKELGELESRFEKIKASL